MEAKNTVIRMLSHFEDKSTLKPRSNLVVDFEIDGVPYVAQIYVEERFDQEAARKKAECKPWSACWLNGPISVTGYSQKEVIDKVTN